MFLIGGCLMMGHAGVLGVRAFSDLTTPPDLFAPVGHLVALVGLVGLYPLLVDRWPWMTRTAVAVAVVAIVSWGVMTASRLLTVVGAGGSDMLPGAVVGLMFVSTVLTYFSFGVVITRVSAVAWRVGLLALTVAALLVGVLVASVVIGVAALEGFVVAVGLSLTMVSMGYTLRTRATGTGQAKLPGDMTVE